MADVGNTRFTSLFRYFRFDPDTNGCFGFVLLKTPFVAIAAAVEPLAASGVIVSLVYPAGKMRGSLKQGAITNDLHF